MYAFFPQIFIEHFCVSASCWALGYSVSETDGICAPMSEWLGRGSPREHSAEPLCSSGSLIRPSCCFRSLLGPSVQQAMSGLGP